MKKTKMNIASYCRADSKRVSFTLLSKLMISAGDKGIMAGKQKSEPGLIPLYY